MDKCIVELAISDLQKNSDGIDLWSKAYFFDKKWAQHRNKELMRGGPFGHRSRLSILLREGMTDEHREKIFDGKYDLGNMKPVPPELSTIVQLANALYGKVRSGNVANDAFETIKETIRSITGRSVEEHRKINESTALKVIENFALVDETILKNYAIACSTSAQRREFFLVILGIRIPTRKSRNRFGLLQI